MTPDEKKRFDHFERANEGSEARTEALFKALEGAPAAAIRKYLEDSGVRFAETRMFRGDKGSSVWAVGSHASGTLSGKDIEVEFGPDAIHLARLLGIVLNVSRLPEDEDVGRPEGFRNPDGSINIEVLR
ncbi:hypothetical protein OIU34_21180 [Pararhizobium sp. BT-229]|uniref:hypothetical protein n=1 Tax=Pararhizobium sp. BT-229 TaxID=2986923 RepID=UPI0021F782BA|nr:hypothetical protein [Pararhizobium sp. BT-229]MCV9964405.1 hypothetical protein [Pararhizobium sp. BT-229]